MISVVIPTYNVEPYIARALGSVLAQTFREFEVVLVDDGSVDRTVEVSLGVLQEAGWTDFKVVRGPHRGPGAARNAGIREARFEWIAFLDSDDYWKPNKLEEVAYVIEAWPDVTMISHYEIELFERGGQRDMGNSLERWTRQELVLRTYHRTMFTTSGVSVRRQLLLDVGLFDETLPSVQDRDLWIRLAELVNPYWIRERLGFYVNRPGNITSHAERRYQCSLIVSKRHLPLLRRHTKLAAAHVLFAVFKCRARAIRSYFRSREPRWIVHHALGFLQDVIEMAPWAKSGRSSQS